MSIYTIKFKLDDDESKALLNTWRDTALEQLSDCSPQDSAALFDLLKKIPGIFMKHHVMTFNVAGDYLQYQKNRNERSLRAISLDDCIAPYLVDQKQLGYYINFVGLGRVITEINYAFCCDLVISKYALAQANIWINQRPEDWVVGLDRSLYPLSSPLMLTPSVAKKQEVIEVKKPLLIPMIEEEDELETIEDNELSVVFPEYPDRLTTVVKERITEKTVPKPKTALDVVCADPFESMAIPGAQRTGKSYFAAIASRKISESRGVKIYHLNLASYGNEDELYWQHAHESIRCDISVMDAYDASYYIAEGVNLVKKFYADPDPAIFICDEFSYIGSTNNQHKDALEELIRAIADKISVMASNGKKRFKAIWTIFPEFVAGTLTQDAKAVKKLTLCYMSIHKDRTVDWNGQQIGFSTSLFSQIARNYEISYPTNLPESDRVAYIGGWMPIGELGTIASPVENKLKMLSEYLMPVLEVWQQEKDITQVHRYIDSIMAEPRIQKLGLSKQEVLLEMKGIVDRVKSKMSV